VSRDVVQRLRDIEAACSKILRHTAGLARDEAFADELRFDGILLNLHVIGEAVKNLPEDLQLRYFDVPWRRIAGMRDFISHAYFAVDLDIVWDTVTRDVPELLGRIREILELEAPASDNG
jgi:uncharacterized protein with HEPN domain